MKKKISILMCVMMCAAFLGGCGKQYTYVGNVADYDDKADVLRFYGGAENPGAEEAWPAEYKEKVKSVREDIATVVEEYKKTNISYNEEDNVFVGIPGTDGAKSASDSGYLNIKDIKRTTSSGVEYEYDVRIWYKEKATGDLPDKLLPLVDKKKIKGNTLKYIEVHIEANCQIDYWEEVDETELFLMAHGYDEWDGIKECEVEYWYNESYFYVMY